MSRFHKRGGTEVLFIVVTLVILIVLLVFYGGGVVRKILAGFGLLEKTTAGDLAERDAWRLYSAGRKSFDVAFEEKNAQLQKELFDQALVSLTDLVKKYPTSDAAPYARILTGDIHRIQGNTELALSIYRDLTTDEPFSRPSGWAFVLMGWILESEEKYTPALDAYEKVFLTETDDKTKSNAFARLQSIYALPEYASRGRAFLSQLRDIGYISPSEEFVQSANLQWAEAEVLLRRAQDARDAGTLAEAAAAYAQVMQKVPDDGLLCPQARFSLRSICRDPKNAQLCSPYESVLAAIKCGVIPDLPPLSGAK